MQQSIFGLILLLFSLHCMQETRTAKILTVLTVSIMIVWDGLVVIKVVEKVKNLFLSFAMYCNGFYHKLR